MNLIEVIKKAGEQFRFYEKNHRAKAKRTEIAGGWAEIHQKAEVNKAMAEMCEGAQAEAEAIVRDAKRWRALIGSGRLSLMGWSGFHLTSKDFSTAQVSGSGYMHFTMNFWNVSRETKDLPDDIVQRSQEQTEFCRRMVDAYADTIIKQGEE